jgi:hypothetical protein
MKISVLSTMPPKSHLMYGRFASLPYIPSKNVIVRMKYSATSPQAMPRKIFAGVRLTVQESVNVKENKELSPERT